MHSTKNLQYIPSRLMAGCRTVFTPIAFYLYTIWLLTVSDLKTIVFPQSVFGIVTALSRTQDSFGAIEVLWRAPLVVLWVWINLLPLDISNQRQPGSVTEDRLNKPWRVIPSGRWSPGQAKYNMLFLYLVAICVSIKIGGLTPCLALIGLGFIYNNKEGANADGIMRNFWNATGYTSFGIGALELALNRPLHYDPVLFLDLATPNLEMWLLIIGAIITTTVHVQDMPDQEGDAARGRKTLPLQIGESTARWSIFMLLLFWGIACPLYWQCEWLGYGVCSPLAFVMAYRSVRCTTVSQDERTWTMWNMWMAGLYTLPLVYSFGR